MIFIDDRVETAKVTDRSFCQRGRVSANILAVNIARDAGEFVKLALGHEVRFVGEATASGAEIIAVAQIGFFITEGEEQAIRDDRT